jgi:hypothetical protein
MSGRNHEKDKLLSTPSALQAKDLEREIKASGERGGRTAILSTVVSKKSEAVK